MLKKMVLILSLFVMSYTLSTCKNAFSALSEPVNEPDYFRIYLPRTGQTTCYDATSAVDCSSTSGTDGNYQMGAAWPNPRFRDNGSGTVTDRLTGLIWVKNGNLITAYNPSSRPHTAGKVSWQNALDYIKDLNTQRYLGYSDWRLPNVNELAALANYGQTNTANWLNTQGFSGILGGVNHYWSATTNAGGTHKAWMVQLSNAYKYTEYKTSAYYVLAVRSGVDGAVKIPKTGQTTCYDSANNPTSCAVTGQDGEYQQGVAWPNPRFRDNGNGTVTDRLTGLIWIKDGSASGTKIWQGALDYVKTLSTGGYTDWRLPNINELQSLINYGQADPADWLNSQGFSGIRDSNNTSDQYFSGSTYAANTGNAWYVYLYPDNINVGNNPKAGNGYVLGVRSGH